MNKILILGSGAISSAIRTAALKRGDDCEAVALRSMKDELLTRSATLRNCTMVIYAGYDPFSIRRNIEYLRFALEKLKDAGFDGVFVFLNTQGALVRRIATDSLPGYDGWIPNRYAITKRRQSKIVQQSGLRFADYYLPLVIGDGVGQDAQLRQIADSAGIEVPMRGENKYYFLHIDSLNKEIFEILDSQSFQESQRTFLYSHYGSLVDFVRTMYGGMNKFCDVRYRNAYNLPVSSMFQHLTMKFAKSLAAIFYYSFFTGNKRIVQQSATGIHSRLGPDMTRFFALNFAPPEQIPMLKVKKI